ncbi:MAG: Gfo/Idh/MocA family oxidoreductase [Trueperaceae bacterium]
MRELRIGLVGCGFMGSLHAATLSQSPGATLAAVYDTDEEAAQRVASPWGAQVAHSLEQLLGEHELDGVVVATPDALHLEPVLAAAQAGLGVLVEKPLASEVGHAQEMITACEEAGVLLMVGHILRFETAYANLRLALHQGVVGRVVSVFARRHGIRTEAQRFGSAGHVLDYLAVHDFDMLNWLRGETPVSVSATAARRSIQERFGTPDVVVSTLEYGDGSIAAVESGWTLPTSWNPQRQPAEWSPFGDVRLDVFGEEGMLSVDLRTMNLIGVDSQGWRMPETRHWPRLHGRITGALREEVAHFLECLRSGGEPVSSGRSSLAAVELCAAAHLSLREGNSVRVEQDVSEQKVLLGDREAP